ncbi:MAG: PD-(D/E)XK nuclease family protein [Paracoccaceae bacterium]|nr:PD-(D/E)XK nuclease family protein [Paracoccaceae bacterium]
MFEPSDAPRLFGLPPGADFPARVAAGLRARLAGAPPEALARVEIYVNTRRMQRRLKELLAEGAPLLLPRLRLVTELGADPALDLPPAASALRRRLELAQLVLGLLEKEPDLAPRSAAFALADSLASLMDEMQGEGVAPAALHALDVSQLSEHWARSRRFLEIVEAYLAGAAPDAEARQRAAVERLAARWAEAPPAHPVIVAGSTGSRGATALFMAAVARLPQGAVILPGFDFDLAPETWARLRGTESRPPAEDHPQYRFARLAELLGTTPGAVRRWDDQPAPNEARNRLLSLALRPAPATDGWLEEGPRLKGLAEATAEVSLIEAPDPRREAVALALRLRRAVEEGQTAALVSPDRTLTRRVAAALDRWGIEPDDSAGRPLALSPPGRFLLHTVALFGRKTGAEALLALLKHPLCHSGTGRGEHLRHTRDLELHLRRYGPPFPRPGDLAAWAAKKPDRGGWAGWLGGCLSDLGGAGPLPLETHVARHLDLSDALAAGPEGGAGGLWQEKAGEEARAAMDELAREAPFGGRLTPADYLALLRTLLNGRPVRDPVRPHPGVMIWGTLEARVQGADLVILAGLNDGTWPEVPPPDPWMNRRMRLDAGLLLPERRIGLAAHDFQQAIAAREVVLSRALRDAEAECVPSRWLNRLTTLLDGIAPERLEAMLARGAEALALAVALEDPGPEVPRARRPAPRPPVATRPKALSVTEVQTLIRDPYAIYARHVLGLRPLDPLRQTPDARIRGSALHRVLEVFVRDVLPGAGDPDAAFRETVARVLAEEAPWPAARAAWAARLGRVAGWFLAGEAERQARERAAGFEVKGKLPLEGTGLQLTGKADRIAILPDDRAAIYDYKTGSPPTRKQQTSFDKQLPLLAALAERGAFEGIGAVEVARIAHIALGANPELAERALEHGEVDADWAGLARLIRAYASRGRGYLSRRALERERGREAARDYDHLARFGEWDTSEPPAPEDVG